MISLRIITLLFLLLSPEPAQSDAGLPPDTVYTVSDFTWGAVSQKEISFTTGDRFVSYRYSFSKSADTSYQAELALPGNNGTYTYYDSGTKSWITQRLDGALPNTLIFVETDSTFLVVGPAALYIPAGSGSLCDSGVRQSSVAKQTDSGYTITLNLTGEAGMEAHIWALYSDSALISAWDEETYALWERLDLDGVHRLCFDGAYYQTPSNYEPNGNGMYFLSPAVHPAGVLAAYDDTLSTELCYAMLDAALKWQNDEGWWPTFPKSQWLLSDYGIGAGFYDTRFNCDLTMTLFAFGLKTENNRFIDAALLQANWLVSHTSNHSYALAGGGLLAEDYYWPGGSYSPTHCSLNHQLQEIKVLLTAAKITGDSRYSGLADRLLAGISETKDFWIDSKAGLTYAYLPEGSTGTDYPYLTYNDLYEVQSMLEAVGKRNAALDELMAAKRLWMDTNGITDYYK